MAREETFSAQCSKVGNFSYYSGFYLYVVLKDRDGNSATNKSYVDYKVYCQGGKSGSLDSTHYLYFNIDGQTKRDANVKWTQNSPNISITIAEGSIEVDHTNRTTIPFSAKIQASSYGVAASISGNFTLEYIPRFTTITSFSVSNISGEDGLTKVKYNWSASDPCDWAWYSLDNGANWKNLDNSRIITGLQPGTSYKFKLRVRRTDSQLTTDSSTVTKSTYAKATITEPTANFSLTNNDSLTVKCTNPSGANMLYFLDFPDGTRRYASNSTLETSYVWNNEEIFDLLQYVTTSNSLPIKVGVATLVGGIEKYYSQIVGTYYVVDSNPIFSNFTYKDVDTNIVNNLTGNDQTIIKGYSDVQALIANVNKAVGVNHATISRYRLSIGEGVNEADYSETEDVSITIENATSNIFTVYAIDSRENSTPKQITALNFIDYQPITVKTISAIRTGSVQAETTLKLTGSIWDGSFGKKNNAITNCYYKYKKITENNWSENIKIVPTQDGGDFYFNAIISGDLGAEGFDIDETFEIQVFVTDELSNNELNPASFILGPGTPAIAIYKNKVAIGDRYDTDLGGSLQISGEAYKNGKPIEIVPETLYNNSTGTTGTVPLNEESENFKWLEVHYYDYDNNYSTAIIFPGVVSLLDSYFYMKSGPQAFHKGNMITASGKSITRNIAWEVAITSTGTTLGTTTVDTTYTLFRIIRVLGYR